MTKKEKIDAVFNYIKDRKINKYTEWGEGSISLYMYDPSVRLELRTYSTGWEVTFSCDELHSNYHIEFNKGEEPTLMLETKLKFLNIIKALDKEDDDFIQSLL